MKHTFLTLLFLCGAYLLSAQNSNGIGDTLHALHYNIHLTEINTGNQTLAGFTNITLVPKVDNINSIPLDFKDLTTDSVFVNDVNTGFVHRDELLRILLSNPVSTSDTLSVTVYYHGHPFHESWGGFHYSGSYAFNLGVGFESIPHNLGKAWFPCIDDFTDRATYDVYATDGSAQKAIGGGLLADTVDNGNGTVTWHWRMQHAIPTYLISIAVGDYVRYSDTLEGLRDTLPIYIYTRPSEQNNVAGSFIHLKDILHFYENRFGAYPFSRVGYVGTAIGAMEHAANIAYPNFAINGNTSDEYLYAHELSHMWFGDEVTCADAEEMWLNEGWASFCEMYYKTDLYGEEVVKTEMRDRNKEVLQKTHFMDNGYWALDSVPQQITYGSTSYDKGAVVVNTLRGYLGDSLFFNGMTAYLQANAWHSRTSADMRDFLTAYTGINMTPFFDAWVSTPGTPHFSIDSTRTTGANGSFQTDIYLKQKYKGYNYLADDNVLEVTFLDAHLNKVTDTVHFSGKTGHSVKTTSFYPKAVLMDLNEKIEDATIDNYRVFTEKENYGFPDTYFKVYIDSLMDTAFIQATHHWVAPDSLKTPVSGLRLSTNRYWSINGVFEQRMQARGRFYYDNSKYLDKELIRSENDSVVLLYRRSPSEEWHAVDQVRYGIWAIGYIYTDELKKGEYTLAAWDLQTVGVQKNREKKEEIKIFPNPTQGILHIKTNKSGRYEIRIYNAQAQLLCSFYFSGKNYRLNLKSFSMDSGFVFVNVYDKNQLVKSGKVIVR